MWGWAGRDLCVRRDPMAARRAGCAKARKNCDNVVLGGVRGVCDRSSVLARCSDIFESVVLSLTTTGRTNSFHVASARLLTGSHTSSRGRAPDARQCHGSVFVAYHVVLGAWCAKRVGRRLGERELLPRRRQELELAVPANIVPLFPGRENVFVLSRRLCLMHTGVVWG